MVMLREIYRVALQVSFCYLTLSVACLVRGANATGEKNGEYLEGYPFTGTVYGLTPL